MAVSNYYAAVHGVLAPPGRIVLTASSSEAYGWLFKLLGDPGDAVLVPAPSYPLLDALAELESVTLQRYALAAEDGFAFHAAAVARGGGARRSRRDARRGRRPREPEQPDRNGRWQEELVALLALAPERRLRRDLGRGLPRLPLLGPPGRRPRRGGGGRDGALVFSLGGLSKSAALPQLKLGWILANGPPVFSRTRSSASSGSRTRTSPSGRRCSSRFRAPRACRRGRPTRSGRACFRTSGR